MNTMIRLAAAVNKTAPADPIACFKGVQSILTSIEEDPVDILVFPRLALTSPSCGSLLSNPLMLQSAREQLDNLSILTRSRQCYCIAGLPISCWGRVLDVFAVLYQGRLLGFVPACGQQLDDYPAPLLPPDTVFACGDLRFSILGCAPEELPIHAPRLAEQTGCNLILCPAAAPARAGVLAQLRKSVEVTARALGCAIAMVGGGIGGTSCPNLYQSFAIVSECGEELIYHSGLYEPFVEQCDLDSSVLRSRQVLHSSKMPLAAYPPIGEKGKMLRPIPRNPFLPESPEERRDFALELFELQAASLAMRMQNTGIDRLVLGLSGGLDSTLALLVACAACDHLTIPRENITAVTMPGFGTTDRTHFNALTLIEGLKVTGREISIQAAVLQHFEDIGHNVSDRDVTYENAQARERTQILMDLANKQDALVVGTGDLSESALGFCTFGADQLASYNVNICLTKNMVRLVVRELSSTLTFQAVQAALTDILDTPVSPELLPPDEHGNIQQKSEELLGSYDLHDFFLYHMVRDHFSPAKIYAYACEAFGDEYEPEEIRKTLRTFLRRVITGQFKRSCSPDCADITEVNLCGDRFFIPSDMSPKMLVQALEEGF